MRTNGPPCWPGKTALSTAAASPFRTRIKPARGPRSVLWVVVVVMCASVRVRVRAARDQAGDVRHVEYVNRATLSAICAHAGEVPEAGIGAAAADDRLGLFAHGDRL